MASRSKLPDDPASDQMGLAFADPGCKSVYRQHKQAICRQCGEAFDVPEFTAGDSIELRFCSSACRRQWATDTPTFEVKVGQRQGHRGGNWKVQAEKARKRDGYACRVCGVSEEELGRRLDVHHKIPYVSFRSNVEANKLENLISVCPACHNRLEAEVRRDLPLFRKK